MANLATGGSKREVTNMHIMFTDKLSKTVASTLRKLFDMISSDMIFETEHLF